MKCSKVHNYGNFNYNYLEPELIIVTLFRLISQYAFILPNTDDMKIPTSCFEGKYMGIHIYIYVYKYAYKYIYIYRKHYAFNKLRREQILTKR